MEDITKNNMHEKIEVNTDGSKILFCYFENNRVDYVPMDLGYIVTLINQTSLNKWDCNILPLTYVKRTAEEEVIIDIQNDCKSILELKPRAVFLFVENIQWSKVFALGRAKQIAAEIRHHDINIFIGIQSYKIQPSQIKYVLDHKIVDCVITGNPELVLIEIEDILKKKNISGVYFTDKTSAMIETQMVEIGHSDNEYELDNIPSPYLNHVFDNFIIRKQIKKNNAFRAFLVSSRGCSYGCYYCFRSVKFEKVQYFSAKRFYDEMEYLFINFGVFRFFIIDDAFLYSKERLVEFVVEFNLRKKKIPEIKKITILLMARPESIDGEIVKLLSELQVIKIQLGLQTTNQQIQHYMNRKIDVSHFTTISELLRQYRIKLHLDVVIGLPGDDIESFKDTISYAVSLKPNAMQVKQFYLNPNTLFFNEKDKYGIDIESIERDFDVPYVIRSKDISDKYFIEATDFVIEQIEKNPKIYWKLLSENKNYISPGY